MRVILLAVTLLLSACGFHVRGHGLKEAAFAFHSIYLRATAETPFVADLRRSLESYKLELKHSPEQADVTLEIVSESTDKQILALSGGGQVTEYILYYRVSLRAYDNKQREWLPAEEISLQRNFPYDNSQILAMGQEEVLLYTDMRSDAVQQVMRRLSIARPHDIP